MLRIALSYLIFYSIPVLAADFAKINHFIEKFCTECHDEDVQKGNIRLDNLSDLSGNAKTGIIARIEEQVYLNEMPPKKEKFRPNEDERKAVQVSIQSFYIESKNKSPFREKLKKAQYANYLDHDQLFSGKNRVKAYSPARRWLISGDIFRNKFHSYLGEDTRYLAHLLVNNFSNPFIVENKSSVRYYADGVLNGKHISVIKNNVEWLTRYVLTKAMLEAGLSIPLYPERYVRHYIDTPSEFKNIILNQGEISDSQIDLAISYQFNKVLNRKPQIEELKSYQTLFKDLLKLSNKYTALEKILNTIWLEEEIYYRFEFGSGQKDEFGRKRVTGNEAASSIAYALTDSMPDEELRKASVEGNLNNKEDYKREILRLLNSPAFPESTPRVGRFFREFFGYDKAVDVFKENMRYGDFRRVPSDLIKEADLIVSHWLTEDKNVFENMLGSDKFFVYHSGDNEKVKETTDKMIIGYKNLLKKAEGINWKKNPEETIPGSKLLKLSYKPLPDPKTTPKKEYEEIKKHNRRVKGKVKKVFSSLIRAEETIRTGKRPLPGISGVKKPHQLKAWNIDYKTWDYPASQPVSVKHRKGLLTHPAWLIAHSQNAATDPVKRGHWILENLLAGKVPDIPIGVEANIPDHPKKTLRTRLREVTEKDACWRCHQYMNPLGLPFESFDDFGMYRTQENLESPENIIKEGTTKPSVPHTYKTLPVESHGALIGTGNPKLDGDVKDAFELIDRLSNSQRVRQSIIRHAFRYFMGRNEMRSDSKTIIDADLAYKESGGSFKAVIVLCS